MKSDWTTKKLSDIVEINPVEYLKKGSVAKKIGMDKLQPFCRDISSYDIDLYRGGTKFRNGDTIMARITPCLENGKIAKVSILAEDEIAFGSTEYIVFRAKKNIADEDFLYYLLCSPVVRESAIKSMVGSSGRQRVQTDVIRNIDLAIPPFSEQQKISSLLKDLDDKIALNRAINKNLAEQVHAIYQSWFNLYTQCGEMCPKTWTKATLGDIATISTGKRPIDRSEKLTESTFIPLVGATSIMGYTSKSNYVDRILVIGRVGTHGVVQRFNAPCWASDNTLVIKSKYYEYTCQILQGIDYTKLNRGSTQPLITQSDLAKSVILLPDKESLQEFEEVAGSLMSNYEANSLQNIKISSLRETILPLLLSGELDVSKLTL